MRALTLYQPWASLVAMGVKTEETRGHFTRYRGVLLIHAGMNRKVAPLELRDSPAPFRDYIKSADDLPYGAIVAVAEIYDSIDAVSFEKIQTNNIDLLQPTTGQRIKVEHNLMFGNFGAGRYAWRLGNITAIKPIPCSGKQGLWIPSPEIQRNPEVVAAVKRIKSYE